MLDGKIFCTGQSSKAVFETPEYPGCNAYNRDGVGVRMVFWWVFLLVAPETSITSFKDGGIELEDSKDLHDTFMKDGCFCFT